MQAFILQISYLCLKINVLMKKNIFLFLFFYCMATSLYAQQRLSLPDVDAIGYDANGSWIDLYKKLAPTVMLKDVCK